MIEKNKYKWMSVIIVALTFIFCISIGFADPEPFSEKHIMSDLINDWINEMFAGETLSDIKNLLYIDFDSVKEGSVVVNADVGRAGIINGGTTINTAVIPSLYKIFQNLGVMVLIIYFGVGLLEDLSFNHLFCIHLVKR